VLTPLALLAVAIAPLSLPAASWEPGEAGERQPGDEDPAADRLIPPLPRELSKKETWRLDKATRRDVSTADRDVRPSRPSGKKPSRPSLAAAPTPVGATVHPITTLFNLWTKETLPIVAGGTLKERFHPFLRDHFTNQATRMDVRLIDVLAQVARRFRADKIDVVSGYRSPKYNLMLRKKGHQVARSSQHMEGNAVDFRIRGVPTPVLLRFVRSLRRGGVGYYPQSQFVHSDTGRIRFWRGS
jgi:hypothetical protein